MNEVDIYSVGICYMSLCAPNGMTPQEIERQANEKHPSGVTHPWTIANEDFKDGAKNPHLCEQDKGRLHYLLMC